MRIVLQKVSHAGVTVTDEAIGELDTTFTEQTIAAGYVLLVGVSDADGTRQIDWLAHKISNLRVFEDEQGKMNLSIHDVGGSILSISQFTLFADTRKAIVRASCAPANPSMPNGSGSNSTRRCARRDFR